MSPGIAPGEPWGEPSSAAPDLMVTGDDADLTHALLGTPFGVLVAFTPSATSDVARAVGLRSGQDRRGLALPMDALEVELETAGNADPSAPAAIVVNAVVLGAAPDRLTAFARSAEVDLTVDGRDEHLGACSGVVIATGQWLRGLDLVPRGHPGDGRAEVQAYQLGRGERRAMRARLPTGTHLPHPRIVTRLGRSVGVQAARALPLELDGRTAPPTAAVRVRLVPGRYRLLV
jgi:hypothetical protein